jgi:hypothetical protein
MSDNGDDDAEFLALPARTRRVIDRAFDRGLRIASGRPAKRRKLDKNGSSASASGSASVSASAAVTPDEGGGFMDDEGGGFMDEAGRGFMEEDGGGFMPDEDEGGGFMDEDPAPGPRRPTASRPSRSASASAPARSYDDRIPLRLVVSLLSSLGLPADEDVLAVFRASAEGWGEGEADTEASVSRKDFGAVCAALLPEELLNDDGNGDDDEEMGEDEDEDEDEDAAESSDDDESDDFEPSDSGSEFGQPKENGKGKGKAKGKRSLVDAPPPRLSGAQRDAAREVWDLLKPHTAGSDPGAHILGVLEVKRWAREMGEMWSDDEVSSSTPTALTPDLRHGDALLLPPRRPWPHV